MEAMERASEHRQSKMLDKLPQVNLKCGCRMRGPQLQGFIENKPLKIQVKVMKPKPYPRM